MPDTHSPTRCDPVEIRIRPCPVCDGRGKVDRYSDRPDPCDACGSSGEVGWRIRQVGPAHFEWEEIEAQVPLFEEAR